MQHHANRDAVFFVFSIRSLPKRISDTNPDSIKNPHPVYISFYIDRARKTSSRPGRTFQVPRYLGAQASQLASRSSVFPVTHLYSHSRQPDQLTCSKSMGAAGII
jgi:hypothetical protein